MTKKDYYDLLGVDKKADEQTIKKAFRKLAMKHHPDRNPGDAKAEAQFKEMKEAYDILSDPQKRAAYDQFGHAGVQGGGAGGFGGAGGAAGFEDLFGDIFGDIFGGARAGAGGGRASGGRQRGSDLRYDIELDLEDAVLGKKIEIEVPTQIACQTCSGSGAKSGSSPMRCDQCQGSGQLRMQQGFFTIQQPCGACRGTGQVIKDPCEGCKGQGRVRNRKTLAVKIPPGVDTGDRVRLTQEGEAGLQGGPPGDLYVQVHVRDHALFKREGEHLTCEVPISFMTAALGGLVQVPTLQGSLELKIPPETQTGKVFRFRGKGVPAVRGHGHGDLLCRIVCETPVGLNAEQRKLLEQFGALTGGNQNHAPRVQTWLSRVKQFVENLAKS